jgi:hypothetical protein
MYVPDVSMASRVNVPYISTFFAWGGPVGRAWGDARTATQYVLQVARVRRGGQVHDAAGRARQLRPEVSAAALMIHEHLSQQRFSS